LYIAGELRMSRRKKTKRSDPPPELTAEAGDLIELDGRTYITHSGLLKVARRNRFTTELISEQTDAAARRYVVEPACTAYEEAYALAQHETTMRGKERDERQRGTSARWQYQKDRGLGEKALSSHEEMNTSDAKRWQIMHELLASGALKSGEDVNDAAFIYRMGRPGRLWIRRGSVAFSAGSTVYIKDAGDFIPLKSVGTFVASLPATCNRIAHLRFTNEITAHAGVRIVTAKNTFAMAKTTVGAPARLSGINAAAQ
jgi:hypothetical protein